MGLFDKNKLASLQETKPSEKQHRLLIVDDEPHNLETLADLLAPDYHLLKASSGPEALSIIDAQPEDQPIHMIMTDQRMSKMSGISLLQASKDKLPYVGRMLISGYSDEEMLIQAINQAHVDYFMLKPFRHEELLDAVKRVLEFRDRFAGR